ncbi:MAG: hypothetical protein HKN29_15090 [Rhodothermales bacterium]|nr:hypothetical protein [Rhodothermales bacterium]
MTRFQHAVLPLLMMALVVVLAGCAGPTFVDRINIGFSASICGSVILILDILVLVQIAGTSWKFSRKAIWALIIIFFPVGGLILWWLFGK